MNRIFRASLLAYWTFFFAVRSAGWLCAVGVPEARLLFAGIYGVAAFLVAAVFLRGDGPPNRVLVSYAGCAGMAAIAFDALWQAAGAASAASAEAWLFLPAFLLTLVTMECRPLIGSPGQPDTRPMYECEVVDNARSAAFAATLPVAGGREFGR